MPAAAVLSRIRATRVEPPALAAGDPRRRRVYAPALQQFEELLRAAEQVSAWARPLPLFYALSQAGRAVAAARAGKAWRLAGHGIRLLTAPDDAPLLERRVKPQPREGTGRRDAFGGVADCTGSASLPGEIELGALWASLPEVVDLLPGETRWARALWVEEPKQHGEKGVALALHRGRAGREAAIVFGSRLADHDALQHALAPYPTSRRWEPPKISGLGLQVHFTPRGDGHVLRFPEPATGPETTTPLDELAPEYRRAGERWLRPALAGGDELVSPLVSWWALLYGLSVVARYEPDTWATVLDVDASPLAVPLERLLDDALEVVPQLVLEAILGRPFLSGDARAV